MRVLLIPLAAVAVLSGCATYGDPYGYSYPAYPGVGVYSTPYPATVYPAYQGNVYQGNVYQGNVYGRGQRDRDGDGIPNRLDNDRDNDGVPNQFDSRPNNPRRQ
jgi:hypothetical protein